jgi:hypothetical protein
VPWSPADDGKRLKEDCWEKVRRRVGLKRRKESICRVLRQRDAERAAARGVFGLERPVSCRCAGSGWRAKLDFRSGEPLDDPHRSTAVRAGVKVGGVFRVGSVFLVRRLLCRSQELKAKREELSASSAGQEAEVPDTHEALRKQVQQKAAQELTDR